MRCFFCDREATSTIYTDIDGYQQQIDMCADHLEQVKSFNFKQVFERIITPFAVTSHLMEKLGLGMQKKSKIRLIENCKECYELFHKFLMPLLTEIHERNHAKKTSGPGTAPLYRLRADLEKALKEERYEDAAKIRDEIKRVTGENKDGIR
jgi:protein-arginine kinase activator protein McsA